MTNHSTGSQAPSSPEVSNTDEAVIEDRLQRRGYVRLHRAVWEDCGIEAAALYGIIEDYAQLSIRNQRPCMPKQSELATKLGTSDRQVRTHLTTLEKSGWISTKAIGGNRSKYTLTRPEADFRSRPEDNFRTDRKQTSAPNSKPVSSKPEKTITNNTGTHYWNPLHEFFFQKFWEHYPKQEKELAARQAWIEVIGTQLDDEKVDSALWKAIFFGVQWYGNKVRTEKTEAKYIASPDNWIRGERWNDAPAHIREGKV